jgi:hypothetical protein
MLHISITTLDKKWANSFEPVACLSLCRIFPAQANFLSEMLSVSTPSEGACIRKAEDRGGDSDRSLNDNVVLIQAAIEKVLKNVHILNRDIFDVYCDKSCRLTGGNCVELGSGELYHS